MDQEANKFRLNQLGHVKNPDDSGLILNHVSCTGSGAGQLVPLPHSQHEVNGSSDPFIVTAKECMSNNI